MNDLWQALARVACGVKEQEQAESTKRELEFVALTAQLAETSHNSAIALQAPRKTVPHKRAPPAAQLSEGAEVAYGGTQGEKGVTSTADGEEQDVEMESTAEGAQQEVEDLVADIVATKSGCEFQSVRGDAAKLGGAFFDEAIEVPLDKNTEKLRDGLIFASLEALVVSEATRADLATKLEEQ